MKDKKADASQEPKLIQLHVDRKKQLIKVVKVEKKGRLMDMLQVINFNIDTVPQASKHSYTGGKAKSDALKGVQRIKVPVKDGMS